VRLKGPLLVEIGQFLRASTPDEWKQIVDSHPTLLLSVVDRVLADLEAPAVKQKMLIVHRRFLLRRARLVGIDEALLEFHKIIKFLGAEDWIKAEKALSVGPDILNQETEDLIVGFVETSDEQHLESTQLSLTRFRLCRQLGLKAGLAKLRTELSR
jgi:hypothetical protein